MAQGNDFPPLGFHYRKMSPSLMEINVPIYAVHQKQCASSCNFSKTFSLVQTALKEFLVLRSLDGSRCNARLCFKDGVEKCFLLVNRWTEFSKIPQLKSKQAVKCNFRGEPVKRIRQSFECAFYGFAYTPLAMAYVKINFNLSNKQKDAKETHRSNPFGLKLSS